MKKIIDWLYWEGIRKFVITSFIIILGGTILISIENTEHIGGIVLISWLICTIAYLFFACWYEKEQEKNLKKNKKNS